jgi:SPASM domain peptide maturase of grasp-with-spasm system
MPIKDGDHLVLFETCVVTSGATRSIIFDIQRGNYFIIPKSFGEFIKANNKKKVVDIYAIYGVDCKEIVDEYLKFLIENEIGFYSNHPELFPPLANKWNAPSKITNAIIDYNKRSNINEKLYLDIRNLGVKHLQLRFLDELKSFELKKILTLCIKEEFESIEIVLKFIKEYLDPSFFNNLCIAFPTISLITIMNAPKDHYFHDQLNNFGHINFSSMHLEGIKSCGLICQEYFSINIRTYTESLHHNSCLNRKISIDVDGNIKNCPSMKESFGNVQDTTLEEALAKRGFKKHWNTTKDKIKVCQDCEFKYICTDCRAYTEDPNDKYSKPLKCGYDPYAAKWEEWSRNPLKQKAIDHYGMREIVNSL